MAAKKDTCDQEVSRTRNALGAYLPCLPVWFLPCQLIRSSQTLNPGQHIEEALVSTNNLEYFDHLHQQSCQYWYFTSEF
jgi:hypothetical protein